MRVLSMTVLDEPAGVQLKVANQDGQTVEFTYVGRVATMLSAFPGSLTLNVTVQLDTPTGDGASGELPSF